MNDDDKKKDQHQNTADTGDGGKPDTGGDKPKPPESGPIHFKVNGVELVSEREKLTALEILKIAREHGAIEEKPENYLLQPKEGGKYNLGDVVSIQQGAVFRAVLQGETIASHKERNGD